MLDLTSLIKHLAEAARVQADAIAALTKLVPVQIAVVNQSTVIPDAEVAPVVQALQIQVQRDFAPLWGKTARLWFFAKGAPIAPSYWQLVIFDDADTAGALGYHEITASGQPLGKVFAKTTIDAGMSWMVTVSHELLEILADPWVNLSAEFDDQSGNPAKFYSYEVADAPESDVYGYTINGVKVSDFVTPAWFMPGMPGPYDFQNHITAPFQILPGGYIGELDISASSGWQQINNEKRRGMRLNKRQKPRAQWQRSAL